MPSIVVIILRGERSCNYMVVLGWRPAHKREVGRPKKICRRAVEAERQQAGWNDWNTVRVVAGDRVEWKQNVAALYVKSNDDDDNDDCDCDCFSDAMQ